MAKLNDEQQSALDELLALRDAPDADTDDDFEIEIYSGDKGARVPFSKGKSWLRDTFGIDVGDQPAADDKPAAKSKAKGTPKADDGSAEEPAGGALTHFQQRQQARRQAS